MIPTTDHDQGQPPLYSGPVGALVAVRLDGHRWAMVPPGDPTADVVITSGFFRKMLPKALPSEPSACSYRWFYRPFSVSARDRQACDARHMAKINVLQRHGLLGVRMIADHMR